MFYVHKNGIERYVQPLVAMVLSCGRAVRSCLPVVYADRFVLVLLRQPFLFQCQAL